MPTEFKGDPVVNSHIDWRHGPLSPAKDDAMSEEQFKLINIRLDYIYGRLDALTDFVDKIAEAVSALSTPAEDPPADPKPEPKPIAKADEAKAEPAKVTPLKPKASKAHPKS